LSEEYLEFVVIQSAACVRVSLVLKTLGITRKGMGDLNMCMSEVRCTWFKEMQQSSTIMGMCSNGNMIYSSVFL